MKILLNGAETALITLNKEETDAGVFVTPTLFSETKITVDTVEFVFDVPKINALAFNNGFCTNDFVSVAPLDEEFMSRDIVMVKGDDGMLSVGTVTAERFLTRYFTSREKCVFRIELENREYSGKVLLEKFVYSRTKTGGEFFSAYCDLLKMEYDIKLPEKIDTGWSSWSYYYRNITEEDTAILPKKSAENRKNFSERIIRGLTLYKLTTAGRRGTRFRPAGKKTAKRSKTLKSRSVQADWDCGCRPRLHRTTAICS